MITLSKKADYGLVLLEKLAQPPHDTYRPISSLAETHHLPQKFLSLIAAELKQAGILKSKEGLGGGYKLAKPASQITVSEVIKTLDGPIAPVGCLKGEDCQAHAACEHQSVMKKIGQLVEATLTNYTIMDLIK